MYYVLKCELRFKQGAKEIVRERERERRSERERERERERKRACWV